MRISVELHKMEALHSSGIDLNEKSSSLTTEMSAQH